MTSLFISGSGTGVGKTYVTTILLNEIRQAGLQCTAIKPVISGFDEADPAESDTALIMEASGRTVSQNSIDDISPWRFREPISPDMAAMREERSLDIKEIASFCRDCSAPDSTLLIEGVGGVMVPLTDTETVLDLMVEIGAPALLVVGSYLGTLSHTFTALKTVESYGLTVAGIVVSESLENPVPLSETVVAMSRFVGAIPVIPVPRDGSSAIAKEIGLI